MAYRVRFYMEMNAREAMHVIELRSAPQGHPAYRRVCQRMHTLIAERAGHHAIAEAMRFADHSEVALERLNAERALEARRAGGGRHPRIVTPVFSHQLDVRFRNCDPMGHVNNAVYLTYLEQARFHHWRASGLAGQHQPSAPAAPTPRPHARSDPRPRGDHYRRPAKYADVASTSASRAIGRTSFTYEYEIHDDADPLVATAKTVIVRFDYAAGKARCRSREELKAALTRTVEVTAPEVTEAAEGTDLGS